MARTVWGIELGTTSVKAVKLQSGKDGLEISDLDVIELTGDDADLDEDLQQTREEKLELALSTLKQDHGIRNEAVWISIPGHQSINRIISLPLLDPRKFRETVRFEAQQHLPISMEEIIWDYQLVNRNPKVGEEVQVSLFAVRREIVRNYLDLTDSVGLNVAGIQVAPLAIYNFIKSDQKFPRSGVVVDIGADNTDVVIIDESKIWIRNVPSGGATITRTLAERFRIGEDEAEKLKLKAPKSKQAQKIFGVMKPALRELLNEINRSLGFYKSQNPKVKLGYMMLMGAGAHLLGLKKFFEQQLQIRVDKLGHLKKLQRGRNADPGKLQDNISTMAVALGLAVQGVGAADNRINLVPPEIKVREQTRRKFPIVAAAAVVMALAALLPMFGVSGLEEQGNKAERALKSAQAAIRENETALEEIPPTEPIEAEITRYTRPFGGYGLANLADEAMLRVWRDRRVVEMIRDHNRQFDPFPDDPDEFEAVWNRVEDLAEGRIDGQLTYEEFSRTFGAAIFACGLDFVAAAGDDAILQKEEARAMKPGQARSQPVFISLGAVAPADFAFGTRRGHGGRRDQMSWADDQAPMVRVSPPLDLDGEIDADADDEFGEAPIRYNWFFRNRGYEAQLVMGVPVDFDPEGQDGRTTNFFRDLYNRLRSQLEAELETLLADHPDVVAKFDVNVNVDDRRPRSGYALLNSGTGNDDVAIPTMLYRPVAMAVKLTWREPLAGVLLREQSRPGHYVAEFGRAALGPLQAAADYNEGDDRGDLGPPHFIMVVEGRAASLDLAINPNSVRQAGNRVVAEFELYSADEDERGTPPFDPASAPTSRIRICVQGLPPLDG